MMQQAKLFFDHSSAIKKNDMQKKKWQYFEWIKKCFASSGL